MAIARVEQELPASADEVWSLIQDFGDVSAWAVPGLSVTRSEGSGQGALRWLETPQGAMVERCETHDPSSRTFSYSITDGPENMKRYLSTVSVRPASDNSCTITWGCDFELDGVPEAAAVQLMESTYRDGFIATLRRNLLAADR